MGRKEPAPQVVNINKILKSLRNAGTYGFNVTLTSAEASALRQFIFQLHAANAEMANVIDLYNMVEALKKEGNAKFELETVDKIPAGLDI